MRTFEACLLLLPGTAALCACRSEVLLGGDGSGLGGSTAHEAGADSSYAGDTGVDAPMVNDAGSSEGSSIDASEPGNDAADSYTVFVSSTLYNGNLGGLSGADSKCQDLAKAAGLTGTYKAWLSDTTTSASYRLTHAGVPYVLVDGTVVAQNWQQLISGGDLLHAIDKTESGGAPPIGTFQCGGSSPMVWTYTDPSGAPLGGGLDCSDWTSNTVATGFSGEADSAMSPWWTQTCQSGPSGSASTCADTAALYCMQQ
jgi:hypothetical protein